MLTTITLFALVAITIGVVGPLLVAKRHQRKAQAADDAPVNQEPAPEAQPTADEIAKQLAKRRAYEESMRLELEQCTDADLEAIEAPRFMFLRYSDDQGFRARVTLRQRVAHELLDERVNAAGAIERLDFPADGHAFGGPRTCITHVGEVSFAAQDDDGRLSKLSNWFFDRLRKMCL